MKKKSLLLALIAFTATTSFAKVRLKKSKPKASTQIMGRECCTKSGYTEGGAYVSITVCSGWLLSNSDKAKARACAAAEEALQQQ